MTPSTSQVPLGAALRFWLKLGFISFGGPAGQIAIMHRELVDERRWISDRRFLHALNYCMVLPGPEAQQLATYLGWLMHGTWGGIAAGVLFVLPSLVLLIALSWPYLAFGEQPAVAGVLYGIKPAVTAIVLAAAWRMGTRTLKNAFFWAIAVSAFVAIFAFDVPFPAIILAAALLGVIAAKLAPHWFDATPTHAAAAQEADQPALIGDTSPTPAHARYSPAKLGVVIAVCVGLGGLAFALLVANFGWASVPAAMAWFFTKAALLTFGGAYAVLPYVYEGAVEQHGWLTATQMIDGLALGETTPGPLIMVVAFVGFVGGWTKAVLGPNALVLAGVLCAVVVTFFTFLPSFLFILAGGPLVEATRDQLRLTAPLTCITAAVVGVIVNLAVFFAWKVFWPQATAAAPLAGPFDVFSVLLAVAAFVALTRFQANVIAVIGACGAAGLIQRLVF